MQKMSLKALGCAALIAVSPIALMAQETPPPPPGEPMPPAEPMPPEAPPPGDPMPAPQPMPEPPSPPSVDAPTAIMPVAATKEYPLCSKTVQDSCRNPGEAPKAMRKKRR